jgi:hypothetical protein
MEEFKNYQQVLIMTAGTILIWGNYERNIIPKLKNYEYTTIGETVKVWQPMGKETNSIKMNLEFVESTTMERFVQSHASAVTNAIDDSNISYLMHNELPVYGEVGPNLDCALTVSSGFFINGLMYHHGFTSSTQVHHIDISKISLNVRQYTIKNWDGVDIENWIKHLQEKYPSMSLFNRYKFTSRDSEYLEVWNDLQQQFGDQWQEHWKQYQRLDHHYHRINISNINDVNSVLQKLPKGNGVFWWNGALKRMPSNLLKDSNASHVYAIKFIEHIADHNPNTVCYGSDHCLQQYNGLPASVAAQRVNEANSRELLWNTK